MATHGKQTRKDEIVSTILIVDDDVMTLRMLEYTLSSAGHTAVSTAHPEEAAGLAEEHDVEAVILDVMMPGRSGYEVLSELHDNTNTSKIPILMLSSLSQSTHRVKGLREGADEYIGKPFDPEELILRLNRLLASTKTTEVEFQGRLETVSFAEVAQSLLHGNKVGVLEVVQGNRRGEILIAEGRAVSANFGRLKGSQAVLAMLELTTGSFSFTERAIKNENGETQPEVSLQQAIFTSAWLLDEITRWPAVGEDELLWITAEDKSLPAVPEGYEVVPLLDVWQEVVRSPGIPLKEVIAQEVAAPKLVKLAVRIMVHTGTFRTSPTIVEPVMPSGDGATGQAFELENCVAAVVHAAHSRGFAGEIVHILLVVEPELHAPLLSLRQQIPSDALAAPGDSFIAAWQAGRPAALPLRSASGQLVVHIVSSESRPARVAIQARMETYSGVAAWVHDPVMVPHVQWIVDLVEGAKANQWGLLIADTRETAAASAASLEGTTRWRLAVNTPATIEQILHLLAAAATPG